MNCARVQQQIVNALAAEQATLHSEVAGHLADCATCRARYEQQRRVFSALERGLEALVNEEVPALLLPRLRARAKWQPPVRHFGFYGWSFAFISVAAILLLTLGWIRHRSASGPALIHVPGEIARTETPEPPKDDSIAKATQAAVTARRLAKRPVLRPSALVAADSLTEVIVLPEEREEFARFVAQVPENPLVALALTRPLAKGSEAPVEIALLTIKPLELKSLEPSEE